MQKGGKNFLWRKCRREARNFRPGRVQPHRELTLGLTGPIAAQTAAAMAAQATPQRLETAVLPTGLGGLGRQGALGIQSGMVDGGTDGVVKATIGTADTGVNATRRHGLPQRLPQRGLRLRGPMATPTLRNRVRRLGRRLRGWTMEQDLRVRPRHPRWRPLDHRRARDPGVRLRMDMEEKIEEYLLAVEARGRPRSC